MAIPPAPLRLGVRSGLSPEGRDALDEAVDLAVEFLKFGGRDPIFLVDRRTDRLNRVFAKGLGPNAKPKDVAGPTRRLVIRVPVSSDLRRVLLIRHRIEERLLRQARGKPLESRRLDQLVFELPNRPVQDCQIHRIKNTKSGAIGAAWRPKAAANFVGRDPGAVFHRASGSFNSGMGQEPFVI